MDTKTNIPSSTPHSPPVDKSRLFKIILLVFVAVMIPVTVLVALQIQKIGRKAAYAEATVNFAPTTVTKAVGETFAVDLYVDSGAAQVSALKFSLVYNSLAVRIKEIQGPVSTYTVGQSAAAGDDLIYDPSVNPKEITVLYKQPTADLPKGSFKAASVVFTVVGGINDTISLNSAGSEAVGYNGQNTDVSLTLKTGTSTELTATGSLCSIDQCIEQSQITLTEVLRPDGTWSVVVSWPASATGTSYYYKIYRNIDSPVLADHPDANLIGITESNMFHDTNNGSGFSGATKVYYDIDTYQICP